MTVFRYPDCNLTCLYGVFWGWVDGKLINKHSCLGGNLQILLKVITVFIFGTITIDSD